MASQKSAALPAVGDIRSVPADQPRPSELSEHDVDAVQHPFNEFGRRREGVLDASVHCEGFRHVGFLSKLPCARLFVPRSQAR